MPKCHGKAVATEPCHAEGYSVVGAGVVRALDEVRLENSLFDVSVPQLREELL